jgi:hypothetical protein
MLRFATACDDNQFDAEKMPEKLQVMSCHLISSTCRLYGGGVMALKVSSYRYGSRRSILCRRSCTSACNARGSLPRAGQIIPCAVHQAMNLAGSSRASAAAYGGFEAAHAYCLAREPPQVLLCSGHPQLGAVHAVPHSWRLQRSHQPQ